MMASKGNSGSSGELKSKQVKKDLQEVQLAYEKLEVDPGAGELLRPLLKLMVEKRSGAAYLALSKVYVLQAIELLLRAEQGTADDAAVARLILMALRTASNGFLHVNSCQCLRLAAELLWVCCGRSEHFEEREAVRQGLVDKLKWWDGSALDPHKCIHGASESLPRHRWPSEWDPRGGAPWEQYVAECNRVWSQRSSDLNTHYNLQKLQQSLHGGLEWLQATGKVPAQHLQSMQELQHASIHSRLMSAEFLRLSDRHRLQTRLFGEMKPKARAAPAAAQHERREQRPAAHLQWQQQQQQQQEQAQPQAARRALAVYSYLLRQLGGCQGGPEAMGRAVQQLTSLSLDDQALQRMPTNADESELQLWVECKGIVSTALESGPQAVQGQQWLRVPVQCVEQWPPPQAFEDTLLGALARQQHLGVRLAREVDRLEEVQLAISASGRHSLESLEVTGDRVQLAQVAPEELLGQLLPPLVLSVDRQPWAMASGKALPGGGREYSEELGDYLGSLMDSLVLADSLVTPCGGKRWGVLSVLDRDLEPKTPEASQALAQLGAGLAVAGRLWFQVHERPEAFQPPASASGAVALLSPPACDQNILLDLDGLVISVLGVEALARMDAWGQVRGIVGHSTGVCLAACAAMLVALQGRPLPASDDAIKEYKAQLGLRIQHMVLHLYNTGRLVGTAIGAVDTYINHALELHGQELLALSGEEERDRRAETLLALCRLPLGALLELEAFFCILATFSFSGIWECVPALQAKMDKGSSIFQFLPAVGGEGSALEVGLSLGGAQRMLSGFRPEASNGSQVRAAEEDEGAQLRARCARFACLSQGITTEQLQQLGSLEQSLKARKKAGGRPGGASQAQAGRRQGELPAQVDLPTTAEEALPGFLSAAAEVAAEVDAARELQEQSNEFGELVGGALGWSGRQQQELLHAVGLSVAAAHIVHEMLWAVTEAEEHVRQCSTEVVAYADDLNEDPTNFLAAERELSLLAAEGQSLPVAEGELSLLGAERELSLLARDGVKTVNTRLGKMANWIGEAIVGALSARAGALAVLACLKRTSLLKMAQRLKSELDKVKARLPGYQGEQWAALLGQQESLQQRALEAEKGAEEADLIMTMELQCVGKNAAQLDHESLVPEGLMLRTLFGLDDDLPNISEEGLEEVCARLRPELERAVDALHDYQGTLEELSDQLALLRDGLHHHTCLAMGMLRAKCRAVPENYVGSYVLTQVLPLRWEQELATAAEEERKALVDALVCEEEEEATKKAQQKSKKKGKKKAAQAAAAQETAAASAAVVEAEAAVPSSQPCPSAPSTATAPAAAEASKPKPQSSQQRQGQQAASTSQPGSLLGGAQLGSRAVSPAAADATAACTRDSVGAGQQAGAGVGPSADGSSSDEEEGAAELLSWYAQRNNSTAGKAAAAAAAPQSAAGSSSRAGASQGTQRPAGQQGSKPGSGSSSRSGDQAAPGQAAVAAAGEKRRCRVVGWDGSWECQCGVRRVVDDRARCRECGARGPCRQYLRGKCSPNCPYPHPPIELPPGPPPPGTKPEVAPAMAEQARQAAQNAGQRQQGLPQQEQREQQHAQQHPQQQAPPRPEQQQQAERLPERAPVGMRVISWRGEWQCGCGLRVEPGLESCSCGQAEPCSEWLRGTCHNTECFMPHPPFSLREDPRPRSKYVRPLVTAWPGAPQFRAPPPAAAAPAPAMAAALATATAAPAAQAAQVPAAQPPEQQQQQQQQQTAGPGQDAAPGNGELLPPGPTPPAWGGAGASTGSGSSGAKPGPLCPVLPGTTAPAQQAQAPPSDTVPPSQGTPDSAANGVCSSGGRSGRLRPGALEFSPTQLPRALPAAAGPGAAPPPPWPATPPGTAPPQHAQHSQTQQHAMPRAPGAPIGSAARPGARSPYAAPGMVPIAGAAGRAAAAAGGVSTVSRAAAGQGTQLLPVQPGVQHAGGNGVAAAPQGTHQVASTEHSKSSAETNCLLSAIGQCLWHCTDFRRQVVSWVPQVYQSNAVVATLHVLFQEMEAQAAGGSQRSSGLSMAGPNQLGEALSSVVGQSPESGQPRDAGVVLLQLYACIRGACTLAAPSGALSADLDAVFGLTVHEYVWCEDCSRRSHDIRYVQYFYNTQAASLRAVRVAHPKARMGALMGHIRSQECKHCDRDTGGCGRSIRPTHVLDHMPRCFTLHLTWQHSQEQQGDIAATLATLDERVDLAAVYEGLLPGKHVYHLRSLLGFSGKQCWACVLRPDGWALLDGTTCSSIAGGWSEVRQACLDRGVQPVLLFYEQGVAAVR